MPAESDIPTELGPAVRALAAGQVVFGRYELRRKLGEGGFGAVWLVYDSALREEIALKFVLQAVAASPEAIDALKAEAARSRRLTHPNIVRIHDFVSDAVGDAHPDLAGISMEYVDGESLAQRRLREPGKCFDVEQIAPWIDQLCQALTYAHDAKRRVIHRDLKPANLLLSKDGELKVADFGIACSLINSVTQISGRLSSGTPPFMSPQQLGGDWPAEADDVYSLGATIYMLLTGTPPFHQGDIVDQVKNRVPESMSERRHRLGITTRATIPGLWDETVAASLAKATAQRPPGTEELARRLGLRPPCAPPAPTVPDAPPVRKTIRVDPARVDDRKTIQARRAPNGGGGFAAVAPPLAAPGPAAPRAPASVAPGPQPRGRSGRLGVAVVIILALLGCYVWWSLNPRLTTSSIAGLQEIRLPFPVDPELVEGRFIDAKKWGYVDGLGHEVIPAQFDAAYPFSEGLAVVKTTPEKNAGQKKPGPYGYLDSQGSLIPPAVRELLGISAEAPATAQTVGTYGYLDPLGQLAIRSQWELAGPFSGGMAVVMPDDKSFGYIDRQGNLISEAKWEFVGPFSGGLARVKSGTKFGYINPEGTLVIPAQWEVAGEFSDGLATVKSDGNYGYIDRQGKLAIPAQWTQARPFSEGLAAVCSAGKYGFIDVHGQMVIPAQWESTWEFSEGLAAVVSGGKSGYIDPQGKLVLLYQWSWAGPFSGGVASVGLKRLGGCIDRAGKVVIPLKWKIVEPVKGSDDNTYFRVVRFKQPWWATKEPDGAYSSGSWGGARSGGRVPAEVRWFDSTGREIWRSP
jgi:serine/threonine protein kinase